MHGQESELDAHYRVVLNRCARTRRLDELGAPAIVLAGERRKLQRAIVNLLQNMPDPDALAHDPEADPESDPPLVESLDGWLMGHASGKPVDASACAVAVPDPSLPPDRLRMPREMARELYAPFAYQLLVDEGIVDRFHHARQLVQQGDPVALAAIEHAATGRPVFVFPTRRTDRPTAIAALDVVLGDEPSVGLPPSIVEAWDLDLAREGVRVHVPLDGRAVAELRQRLGATPYRPASGILHRYLRAMVVREERCALDAADVERCPSLGAPCARCVGAPVGTAVGLRAADSLASHEDTVVDAIRNHASLSALTSLDVDRRALAIALRAQPSSGWIAPALTARREALGAVLFDAAIDGAIDRGDDPLVMAFLGRLAPWALAEAPRVARPLPPELTPKPEIPTEEILA